MKKVPDEFLMTSEKLALEVASKDPNEWTDADKEILRWQYIITATQKNALCAFLETISHGAARVLADINPPNAKNLN
jgi:hypothetical protein